MKKSMVFSHAIILILSGFLLYGCATNSYVNEKFDELKAAKADNSLVTALGGKVNALERNVSASVSNLEGKIGAAEKQIGLVDKKSEDALKKAQEGYALANASINLKPLEEKEVYFGFDKYALNKETQEVLDEVGKMMQQRPDMVLEIAGHTDKIGADNYNMILGQRRAEAVIRYLNGKYDIALRRLFVISYGETSQKSGETKASPASNRRAVLKISGMQMQESRHLELQPTQ